MATQLTLLEPELERRIVPADDRKSPAVWIRELRVLKELNPAREFLARRVVLRRGMNILWASTSASDTGAQLFVDTLSGHSAGKTTFCRILRYVLGEPHFGDDILRRDIRNAFPRGWAIAQVFVSDMSWIVCRPFAIGAHPFVVQSTSIDDVFNEGAIRREFDEYRQALNSATLSDVPIDRLHAAGDPLCWDHVLPWLSRDQDCHFDELTTWRVKASDSGSPQLDADDRQLLLRAVLRLITDEEDRERQSNDRRLEKRRRLRLRRPKLLHQASVDRQRLEAATGSDLPPIDDGLFGRAISNEIDRLESQLLSELPGDSESYDDTIVKLEDALSGAMQSEADATAELKQLQSRLQDSQNCLHALRGDLTQEKRDQLMQDLGPSRGFCNAPMALAIESGCPLAAQQGISFSDRAGEIGIDRQAEGLERVVEQLGSLVQQRRGALLGLTDATARAKEALTKVRHRRDAAIQQIADIRARVSGLRRLAESAQQTWREAEDSVAEEDRLNGRIESSYRKQERIRSQVDQDMRLFSALFDYLIRALLGNEVEGRASFSGRDIDLAVLHRGERRSAAIRIVKNIAFDLAAVIASVEGRGFHPRVLIHDGPRESDMSAELYRKVFYLLYLMEGQQNGDDPPFQYIITTTEPPPKEFRQAPWLLDPILDATDPAKRFLGVDL